MGRQPVLTDVFERISDAFVALDKNWCYTYMNKKAGEIFNRDPREMAGKHIWTEFPGVIDQPFYTACHRALSTQQYVHLEEYYSSYDLWLENHVYPTAEGLSVFFRDITLQKKAEEKILKANRLYNFLSSINHMIVRTKDQSSLFREICDIAIVIGRFRMAWIGMIDENTHEVVPAMFAGEEKGYLTGIKKIVATDTSEGKGPTGTAVREDRIVVCHDVETDPLLAPWREEALARGYHSSIALPIKKFGKIVGAFTVYASEKNFFDIAETALLNEATKDIAFALEILEREELRKRAEEELAKSERRYQTLAEISPVGIFHTDETGYTTYVNPAWCRISGLSIAKALGNGWLDVVHENDKEGLAKTWQEAAKSQRISVMEYRFVRPDGSIRWVMGQAVPQKNLENEVIGYVGTITDITDRKKAEEDLRFNEQQLHLIYDSVADPIFLLDVKENDRFTFISVNQTFLTATGLTEDQVLNKDVNDILPPSALKLVLGKYKQAIQNKESVHWEEISEYPAGIKTGIVSVTPVFDNKGICTRLVGAVHDITGQKRYEEMLLSEKSFSESIINSLPGILYLYDDNRKFIRWNKNFQTVSEYSDEEIVNMDPLDFFDDHDKIIVAEKIGQVFKSGMAEVEAGFFTKSKSKIPYYFNGCKITLGNKTCLIGMGVDISELKNARDEIAEREKRFRYTLDQMMEGVQIYDFDWRCLYINDAAIRQGSHPREVVLNKTLLDNYPGIEKSRLFAIFEECKDKQTPRHIEYEFTFPGSGKRWFDLSIQPNPEGLFILSMDISDRKKAETELQQVTEQLRRLTVHQQTALEEERKRISREIHDELGQQLTAIKMDIAWIDKKMQDKSETIKGKLKNVIKLLDGSNQSIRKILTELRMGVLDNHSLPDALESHGLHFSRNTGIPLVFSTDGKIRNVNEDVASGLFRAFQEALTNITKYADAKKVTADLAYHDNTIFLEIKDDGKGFDTAALYQKNSFGIAGMRERITSLNGQLEIVTSPGSGTKIAISIPYKLN